MWTKTNYRRNLLDMHISDENDQYLQNIDIEQYADSLVAANIQCAIIMAKPHTGLCYWPSSIGLMHRGLHGLDYFGSMLQACHDRGIKVVAYYSQIYDNWAYRTYPSWRLVTPEGRGFMECDQNKRMHQTGRYGIVCPNNPDYRIYVKSNLEELNNRYEFEGMFLDMAFWPEVCYCASCKVKYLEQTGREIPRTIDWGDPDWRNFAQIRYEWLCDFAMHSTNIVKAVRSDVTIEHNFSMVMSNWRHACTELLSDSMDFCSGDFYGGFLQQSFICKYFNSISKTLPFNYHTSRCSPSLEYHTTTKQPGELIRAAITVYAHNGAFMTVDAINPDGSIHLPVYTQLFKNVYHRTMPYESYFGGEIIADVAVWFNTITKFNPAESGLQVDAVFCDINPNQSAALGIAGILRQFNIPYTVVGAQSLKNLKGKVLVIPSIPSISDDEMRSIEQFVRNGGSLYVSGPFGNPRFLELLGLTEIGETMHNFTYICPTKAGETIFVGFDKSLPMTVPMKQHLVKVTKPGSEILATLVLPYTDPGTKQFAAIHANPPGEYTDYPVAVMRQVGEGTIFWIAACIENIVQYQCRKIVERILFQLSGGYSYASNAPTEVEVIAFSKEGVHYFVVINQQETAICSSVYDLYIDLPETTVSVELLPKRTPIKVSIEGVNCRIHLPRLDDFLFIAVRTSNPH